MDRHRLARYWLGGVVALAIGLLGFGAATIASAQAGDTIRACTRNGNIISIGDTSQDCPRNATALDWNKQGPAGPTGPKGPEGPTGPTGPGGPSGVSGYEVRLETVNDTGTELKAVATCSSGKKVLAGGYAISPDVKIVNVSRPGSGNGSWEVMATTAPSDMTNYQILVYAVCATMN
jgi:hypothetical protein